MNFVNFEVGEKAYKLKLSIETAVLLEEKIGMNPLSIFGDDGGTMPKLSTMLAIFHCSLQELNHGISYKDACALFNEWLQMGHYVAEFLPIIIELYRVSGLIRNTEPNSEDAEKNA